MVESVKYRLQSRGMMLCGASIAALLCVNASSAAAQTAVAPQPAASGQASDAADPNVGDITVTATRVVRDGYKAPTPTSVVGAAEIAAKAPANIADLVNQLPALSGSVTPRTAIGSVSPGTNGINALNLRALGQNRTLVLLDGQRVGASTLTGWVDINTFPEALVKRIDVVTGGASAGWGSDAVAGVINFVLDKDFTGLKGEISGGVTNDGDNRNYKLSLTAGTTFAGGRGHIILSGEDAHSDGITGVPRSWYTANKLYTNPLYVPGNGQPQLITSVNTGFATATDGGIITTGPAKGTYFGPGGIPLQFNYGTVSGNFMTGGDWRYSDSLSTSGDLAPRLDRKNIFLRTSFDITDHFQIFAQGSYGTAKSFVHAVYLPLFSNFTVDPTTNAFLPASVATAAGTTPFKLGTYLADYGSVPARTNRNSTRFVLGGSGDFDAMGSNWRWDAYGQETINDIYISSYEFNTSKLNAAVNAVRNPVTGAIQCAALATNPGCVPYNLFGTGVNSQAALDYAAGNAWGKNKITQDVFAANLRGNPINNWAGPISVAFGIEHRREAVSGSNDPVSTTNGWISGNQHASFGSYQVTEGYFETVIPLLKDQFLAKSLNFNGAIRETDYSTSGAMTTWKVGMTYSPVDDITFRGTRSRDIRAPNLSELFATGITSTQNALTDPTNNTITGSVLAVTSGSNSLKPEVADSWGLGVVVQPRFVPGLSFSVDFYDIRIKDAIFTASAQQLINQCAQGFTAVCPNIIRTNGVITQVNVTPINLAKQINRGLDFEASYRSHVTLSPQIDGNFSLRVLATRFLRNYRDTGIAGVAPTDTVGTNSDNGTSAGVSPALPRWKYQVSVGWDQGPLTLGLTGRGFSSGVYNTSYIECASNCPLATTAHPTINSNRLPGAFYLDGNIGYKWRGADIFLVVENIANTSPVQTAYGPGIPTAPLSVSPSLYDTLGRTFRAGMRFKL